MSQSRGAIEEDLIQATIRVWQPYFTTPLGSKDAEEIIGRWRGFFNVIGQTLSSDELRRTLHDRSDRSRG